MKHLKLFEQHGKNIKDYILENNIKCEGVYPNFLYHGTVDLDKFKIDPDLDWEDIDNGKTWDIDMPSGVLFLTSDINEAMAYGKYVIPFELNTKDILVKKINADNPSQVFDEDYNYGSKYNMWQEFESSTSDALEVKGLHKSTFIAYLNVINPRMDIAKKFYK